MKLENHFKQFIINISLTQERIQRIESALSHLNTFLSGDDVLTKYLLDLYPQGSWALDTSIRPVYQEEFDADLVLLKNTAHLISFTNLIYIELYRRGVIS